MHTILKLRSARVEPQPESRVLAIEPDSVRATTLRQIFTAHVGADCQIAQSVNEALASIAQHVPDLLLTSTFLAPPDEAELTRRIKELPGAAHLQIITIPYFIDGEERVEQPGTKILTYWKRRRTLIRPSDPTTVGRQIEAYLGHARAQRRQADSRDDEVRAILARPTLVPMNRKSESDTVRGATADAPGYTNPCAWTRRMTGDLQGKDRRKAKRKQSGDVPWLWSAKLSSGGNVKVVDISSEGVLLETTLKISAGRPIELQLTGEGINLCVPARTTRSEVASVNGLGVRYRIAAVFSRELELPGIDRRMAAEGAVAGALGDLLARALRDVDSGATSEAVRLTFEHGLRRLLSALDVQIRRAPIVPGKRSESIYFSVPAQSAGAPILQAIFDTDRPPSAKEFKLLKAAAKLAAVVLDFAPLEEAGLNGISG